MEEKNLNQYNPTYARDLFRQENSLYNWFQQKRKLPRNIRYGLISLKTEGLVKNISEKYNVKLQDQIGSISVLIRSILGGFLTEDDLRKEIQQRFNFNNVQSLNFLTDLKKTIQKIKKIGLEEVKKDLIALKFQDLWEKLPEIKNQETGVEYLFFPNEERKRKPTLENWITDYKLRKNNQQETTILNISDYLYNSDNIKNLNKEEKENLSLFLNAYEKNEVIYYNKLFEEIDFEILKILNKNKLNKNKTDTINITSFNSKPYHDTDQNEKEKQEMKAKEDFSKKTNNIKLENQKVLNLSKYV